MSLLGNGLSTRTPFSPIGMASRTELGTVMPVNGNVVAIVDNGSGSLAYLPQWKRAPRVATLNQALSYCVSGQGDVVLVGSTHAESISSADQMSNLVAGTTIVGLGQGNLRPTFTWSAAASTFLLDVANVRIHNCILQLCPTSGTVTVAAPITVSAAGCAITGCKINFGTDANAKVTKGIVTTAAADDFTFQGNECYGATAAECTTFLELVGTDRVRVIGNYISCATSAVGVAPVRALTTAHTDGLIAYNYIAHNKTASTAAIGMIASCTGRMIGNNFAILSSVTTTQTLGSYTLSGDNYLTNTVGERGLQLGTESA